MQDINKLIQKLQELHAAHVSRLELELAIALEELERLKEKENGDK